VARDANGESLGLGSGVRPGGTFGLALLLALRAADTETATELSGMAPSAGCHVAASGPVVFGFLYDLTDGWAAPATMLLVTLVAKTVLDLRAWDPGQVRSGG